MYPTNYLSQHNLHQQSNYFKKLLTTSSTNTPSRSLNDENRADNNYCHIQRKQTNKQHIGEAKINVTNFHATCLLCYIQVVAIATQ